MKQLVLVLLLAHSICAATTKDIDDAKPASKESHDSAYNSIIAKYYNTDPFVDTPATANRREDESAEKNPFLSNKESKKQHSAKEKIPAPLLVGGGGGESAKDGRPPRIHLKKSSQAEPLVVKKVLRSKPAASSAQEEKDAAPEREVFSQLLQKAVGKEVKEDMKEEKEEDFSIDFPGPSFPKKEDETSGKAIFPGEPGAPPRKTYFDIMDDFFDKPEINIYPASESLPTPQALQADKDSFFGQPNAASPKRPRALPQAASPTPATVPKPKPVVPDISNYDENLIEEGMPHFEAFKEGFSPPEFKGEAVPTIPKHHPYAEPLSHYNPLDSGDDDDVVSYKAPAMKEAPIPVKYHQKPMAEHHIADVPKINVAHELDQYRPSSADFQPSFDEELPEKTMSKDMPQHSDGKKEFRSPQFNFPSFEGKGSEFGGKSPEKFQGSPVSKEHRTIPESTDFFSQFDESGDDDEIDVAPEKTPVAAAPEPFPFSQQQKQKRQPVFEDDVPMPYLPPPPEMIAATRNFPVDVPRLGSKVTYQPVEALYDASFHEGPHADFFHNHVKKEVKKEDEQTPIRVQQEEKGSKFLENFSQESERSRQNQGDEQPGRQEADVKGNKFLEHFYQESEKSSREPSHYREMRGLLQPTPARPQNEPEVRERGQEDDQVQEEVRMPSPEEFFRGLERPGSFGSLLSFEAPQQQLDAGLRGSTYKRSSEEQIKREENTKKFTNAPLPQQDNKTPPNAEVPGATKLVKFDPSEFGRKSLSISAHNKKGDAAAATGAQKRPEESVARNLHSRSIDTNEDQVMKAVMMARSDSAFEEPNQFVDVKAHDSFKAGHNRGNPEHHVQDLQQRDGNRHRQEVSWSDSYGGYGKHYFEFNHVDNYEPAKE